MTIKLVGSSSGSVSLQAPATTTGGANRVLTLPDADGTVAVGSTGKILQIVEGTLTAGFTTSSQTMVDVGLSATITPSSASNKILVLLSLGSFVNRTSHKRAFANILRGSTVLFVGDAATGEEVTIARTWRTAQDEYVMDPLSRSFLDSPNTTSATTYKLQASIASDGGYVYINRPYTQDANGGNTASSLILMEVAA